METISEFVDLYVLRCEVEGKSPRTVQAYRYTLGRFVDALVEDDAPTAAAEITREHIYGYLGRFKHHAADTRHRYFREVRCFFNWLVDAGYLEQSPFRGVKNIRLPQRIVRPFSPGDVNALLNACDEGPIGVRDRALLMTLLDTGLRCSEVVQLDLADLDLSSGRLRVRFGKGNKQRIVPFATTCRTALAAYLEARGDEAGPLFVASNRHGALVPGVPLQPNGLK